MYSDDVALIGLARALLHQVLDLEHEVVAKGAVESEQRLFGDAECGDDRAHERHDRGAARALLFVRGRLAAHDMAGDAIRRALGHHHAGFAQRLVEE